MKLTRETRMGLLRGHPVAQAYERLAAAIFETAYLSAARIGRRPFTSAEPMKIASFNINNINLRLTNLLNWLREAEPDIVCGKRPRPRTPSSRRRHFGRRVIMRYAAVRGAGTAWRSSRGGLPL